MQMHRNMQAVPIEQKRDRQQLLKAEFKLVKFFHSATEYCL